MAKVFKARATARDVRRGERPGRALEPASVGSRAFLSRMAHPVWPAWEAPKASSPSLRLDHALPAAPFLPFAISGPSRPTRVLRTYSNLLHRFLHIVTQSNVPKARRPPR